MMKYDEVHGQPELLGQIVNLDPKTQFIVSTRRLSQEP